MKIAKTALVHTAYKFHRTCHIGTSQVRRTYHVSLQHYTTHICDCFVHATPGQEVLYLWLDWSIGVVFISGVGAGNIM